MEKKAFIGVALLLFLSAGGGLVSLLNDNGEAEATYVGTPYTIHVYIKYSDTQQPVSGISVKLEDLTTGSFCIKTTDSAGHVPFTIPTDLSSVNNGDLFYVSPEPSTGYSPCGIEFVDSSNWDQRPFTMFLYPIPAPTVMYSVGRMSYVDGNKNYYFNSPSSVSRVNGEVWFSATGSASDSRSNQVPRAVRIYYNLTAWKITTNPNSPIHYASAEAYQDIYVPQGNGDPLLMIKVKDSGQYTFSMKIGVQDPAGVGPIIWDLPRFLVGAWYVK
ncbi:MAG: hypothetical protein DRN40_07520 [Thermoplasmata archaeon]|nr:MAG: hypothetical protein DRN40_07520 [Thermoplasmata archaeon]